MRWKSSRYNRIDSGIARILSYASRKVQKVGLPSNANSRFVVRTCTDTPMQAGLSLVTLTPFCAVKSQGGTMRTGHIMRIPTDSTVTTLGPSRLANMIEIEWHGERYAAFEVDLEQRCVVAARQVGQRWIA